MLKHLTPLLAAALLSGSYAVPAAAEGHGPPSTADNTAFCREFIQEVEGVTLGRCLSFLQTEELGSAGFIEHLCYAFEASDPDEFYLLYSSVANCIVTNRQQ